MKTLVKQKFRYELRRLENIIVNDLADFFQHTPHLQSEFVPDFQIAINDEVQNIKENLNLSPLFHDGPQDFHSYIQLHQYMLFTLAGNLLDYTVPAELGHPELPPAQQSPPTTFVQILYLAIEDLLDFLQTQFPKHFDYNAWLPTNYQNIARHHLGIGLEAMQDALRQYGIPAHLVTITTRPLANFTHNPIPNSVTYRQIVYLKQLKTHLSKLPTTPTDKPSRQLGELLHELNFNCPAYIDHCTAYLSQLLDDTALSGNSSTLILHFYRKLIQQTRVTPGIALIPASPSFTDTLCAWIDVELSYHKSIQRTQTFKSSATATALLGQIITTLTGGQLGYLFTAMLKIQVVTNGNTRELGAILAQVFHTIHDSGQGDSFRQQLYRPTHRSKQFVEQLLIKMLQFVQDDIANDALK